MTAPWPAAGALALLLLAGCASTGAPAGAASGAPAPPADLVEWTGCDGVIVALEGPGALYKGSVPPGWESDWPVNTVRVQVQRCERVSWGPFERGPVSMLMEWHGGFDDPETCRADGAYEVRAMLQSIWFSDPGLAAYARDAHGMPALVAEFGEPAGGARPERTWAVPGQPRSTITFYDLPGEANRTYHLTQRLYWPNGLSGGAGVSRMDYGEEYESDELDGNFASGDLQPPLLHGRAMPSPAFATPSANLQGHLSARATIARFADAACLDPA